MAAKFTRLTHKIGIQLHLVAESCTICSSRSRWPVRKLLDIPSYYVNINSTNNNEDTVTENINKLIERQSLKCTDSFVLLYVLSNEKQLLYQNLKGKAFSLWILNSSQVFCVVNPCTDAVGCQRFVGSCCFCFHFTIRMDAAQYPTTSVYGVTTQKTTNSISEPWKSQISHCIQCWDRRELKRIIQITVERQCADPNVGEWKQMKNHLKISLLHYMCVALNYITAIIKIYALPPLFSSESKMFVTVS
jgi:hypothetical protein